MQPRSLALVSHALSADEDHYVFPASFSFEKIVNSTLTHSSEDISLMSDIKKCTTGTAEMNHTI